MYQYALIALFGVTAEDFWASNSYSARLSIAQALYYIFSEYPVLLLCFLCF